MAQPGSYPFTGFNFSVEINVPLIGPSLCNAEFSECDGLDMTMDVKTIREGGNNTQQIRMIGAVNYGMLTLKRGMTNSFDLWTWFDAQQHSTSDQLRDKLRGTVAVSIKSADHKSELVRFQLSKCLLTRLKAPALNASSGYIAIEELQMSYERMSLKPPQGGH